MYQNWFQLNANFVAIVYEITKVDKCQEAFLVAWKTQNFG